MTNEDLLKLVNAGFTAEEIRGFYSTSSAQTIQPVKPVQPVRPVQPVQTMTQEQSATGLETSINNLISAIQKSALLTTPQPKAQTAEQITASIINPWEE